MQIFAVLSFLSVIMFIILMFAAIIGFTFKKSWGKKCFRWSLFSILSGALCILVIFIADSGDDSNSETEQTETSESTDKNNMKLDENSFNISLKKSEYNSEENSLNIEYETGLPDGTIVELALLSPSLPDSWGEQYDPFSVSYTFRLHQRNVDTTVKDGLISYTFDNEDFNGLLFPNSVLYTTLNINSNDEKNSFIKEEYSTADELNEKISKLHKAMKEQGKDIFALDDENGLQVSFFDNYEIKNAHTIDEIYSYYKKESIPYKELEKNPSKYQGTPISFAGEVLQIQTKELEEKEYDMLYDYSIIRLAVDGDLDQVVYVTVQDINGMEGIVSEDTITVYGVMTGSTTYESVSENNITIPSMDAIIYVK